MRRRRRRRGARRSARRRIALLWLALASVLVVVLIAERNTANRGVVRVAPDLDLSGWSLVFDEPFDMLSVSAWRSEPDEAETTWIAHTPWYGDFGDAVFRDPAPDFPFTIDAGVLAIEARRGEDGTWESGLLSTRDPDGGGFHATTGYFEARLRLPVGPGTWPAFWLGSDTLDDGRSGEVDVIEFYGHDPERFQSAWHVWHRDEDDQVSQLETALESIAPANVALTDRFHLYGVEITDDELVYHVDRRVVWRQTKPEVFDRLRFFPLVNLALGSGYPIDETPDPSRLLVDYVRVWQRP